MPKIQWNTVETVERDDEATMIEWKTEKQVIGRLLSRREVKKKDGDTATIYKLNTAGGLREFWETTVLNSKLSDDNIKVGTILNIQYTGMKKGASGRNYHDFDVAWAHDDKTSEDPMPEPDADGLPEDEPEDAGLPQDADEIPF